MGSDDNLNTQINKYSNTQIHKFTNTQIQLVNLIEENMVPSSVGSEHLVHRQEKYFVSAEYVMIMILIIL